MSSSEGDAALLPQDAQYRDSDLVAQSQVLTDSGLRSDPPLSFTDNELKGTSLQTPKVGDPKSSPGQDDDATETSRPNKYHGPPSTWLRWTAADREIAASLDQLQARDLSVHLYNTHALRLRARRLREDSQFERRGRGKGKEKLKSEAWEPPKTWAAWPMPIAEVPREVGNCGLDAGALDEPRSSREDLEDILLGIATRIARERWEAREWESTEREELSEEHSSKDSDVSMALGSNEAEEQQASSPSSGTSRSRSTKSADAGSPKKGPQGSPSPSHASPASLRPVPLADDDIAASLLLPSIQHSLTHNFDRLLYALHRTRTSYAAPDAPLSDDSVESSQASSAPSRSLSRISSRVRARSVTPGPEPAPPRGRKRKRTESMEAESAAGDETQEEMREEGSGQPSQASTASTWGSSRSRVSSASARAGKKRRARLGLRDWSDVLGLASLQGWDREVVERTRRRCAGLFQENMDFVTLDAAETTTSEGQQGEGEKERRESSESGVPRESEGGSSSKRSEEVDSNSETDD